MKKTLIMALMLGLTGTVHAETLSIEYASFYSHVKKLDDEETNALQFAFGFKRVQKDELCPVNQAFIQTQKQTIPLQVTDEYRFTVPSEKALKMAKALVVVELGEKANLCDMSVQLETKPEYLKAEYDAQTLKTLFSQYQAFFDNMGGFMSFLMPSADGLKMHFDQLDSHTVSADIKISQGTLVLSEEMIERGMNLALPAQPMRITARMDNEKGS